MSDLSHLGIDSEGKPQGKQGRGCFFYGCLTASVISLISLIIFGIVMFWLFQQGKKLLKEVEPYIDTKPREIQVEHSTPEEFGAINFRLERFKQALARGEELELILTGRDINVLIARLEDLKELREHLYITIDGSELKGEISVPLNFFPPLAGKYLNGSGIFTAELKEDGSLRVTLEDMEVRGKKIPELVMKELRGKNLTEEFDPEPDVRDNIRKLKSLKVENGTIVIRSKQRDVSVNSGSQLGASQLGTVQEQSQQLGTVQEQSHSGP